MTIALRLILALCTLAAGLARAQAPDDAGWNFDDFDDADPTLLELAGGRPGKQIQGRSLLPLLAGRRAGWRKSVLIEYWAENAMPWLVGMTYKAVRTKQHKYIRWVNRSRDGELDELYDLERDPYELSNLAQRPAYRQTRTALQRELKRLTVEALGL